MKFDAYLLPSTPLMKEFILLQMISDVVSLTLGLPPQRQEEEEEKCLTTMSKRTRQYSMI